MAGDESRSCPMVASTTNPLNKGKEQRLYFFESSLSKPNELRPSISPEAVTARRGHRPCSCEGAARRLRATGQQRQHELHCLRHPCPQFTNGDLIMPVVQQFRFNARNEDGSVNSSPGDRVHCFYLTHVHADG